MALFDREVDDAIQAHSLPVSPHIPIRKRIDFWDNLFILIRPITGTWINYPLSMAFPVEI
ncbi:MAG: hypothetical protein B6244_11605 [Candidatus Cloacimonetes bacterium 4572_55]|nr:MAG: hypothetical protein B6244_11605 [Candidatus Cloacimonetes bacterium 4572_55]